MQEWGFEYTLPTADLEELMVGSRGLVKRVHKPSDADRTRSNIQALRDRTHPAREFYATFESRMSERTVGT
jgi:hypothetical protein